MDAKDKKKISIKCINVFIIPVYAILLITM